jgi:PKD repeat protein
LGLFILFMTVISSIHAQTGNQNVDCRWIADIYTACPPQTITFTMSNLGSTGNNDTCRNYSVQSGNDVIDSVWFDWGDGQSTPLTLGGSAFYIGTQYHIYTQPGTYCPKIYKRVNGAIMSFFPLTDNTQNPNSTPSCITISNGPEMQDFLDTIEHCFFDYITVSLSFLAAHPVTYIDWGDGSALDSAQQFNSKNHTYTAAGQYWIHLWASDSCGTSRDSIYVNLKPTEAMFDHLINCPGNPSTFQNLSSCLDSSYTFLWDFGDNSSATSYSASHIYATEGNFIVSLSILDTAGNTIDVHHAFIHVQGPEEPEIINGLVMCEPGDTGFVVLTNMDSYPPGSTLTFYDPNQSLQLLSSSGDSFLFVIDSVDCMQLIVSTPGDSCKASKQICVKQCCEMGAEPIDFNGRNVLSSELITHFGSNNIIGKTININGLLIVDQNISFEQCEFILSSGAEIVLQDSITFTGLSCVFDVCDQMWGGFRLYKASQKLVLNNCRLNDAVCGIRAASNAQLELFTDTLWANYLGIELRDYKTQQSNPISSFDVLINPSPSSPQLIAPYAGQSRSYAGIKTVNCTRLDVHDHQWIAHARYGWKMENSKVIFADDNSSSIYWISGTSTKYPIPDHGAFHSITDYGMSGTAIVFKGGTYGVAESQLGVFSWNTLSELRNLSFWDNNVSVDLKDVVSQSVVQDNTFWGGLYGIRARNVFPNKPGNMVMEISENELNDVVHNIYTINLISGKDSTLVIENNSISSVQDVSSGFGHGIYIAKCDGICR